jgi:hypothetical protein
MNKTTFTPEEQQKAQTLHKEYEDETGIGWNFGNNSDYNKWLEKKFFAVADTPLPLTISPDTVNIVCAACSGSGFIYNSIGEITDVPCNFCSGNKVRYSQYQIRLHSNSEWVNCTEKEYGVHQIINRRIIPVAVSHPPIERGVVVFNKSDWDEAKLKIGDLNYQGLISIDGIVEILGEIEDRQLSISPTK